MIRVTLYKESGAPRGFCVRGHAGLAPSGADILCAAVSSAVQLCVNTVSAFAPCTVRSDDAAAEVFLKLDKVSAAAQTALGCFFDHLEDLLTQFPKHLTLESKEE